jgi:uncharacterized protein with HEPN domain
MSKRIDLVYLGDMLDAARRVSAKTTDKTINDFNADDNLQLAIVHLIQVIGEAASRVSEEIRSSTNAHDQSMDAAGPIVERPGASTTANATR